MFTGFSLAGLVAVVLAVAISGPALWWLLTIDDANSESPFYLYLTASYKEEHVSLHLKVFLDVSGWSDLSSALSGAKELGGDPPGAKDLLGGLAPGRCSKALRRLPVQRCPSASTQLCRSCVSVPWHNQARHVRIHSHILQSYYTHIYMHISHRVNSVEWTSRWCDVKA